MPTITALSMRAMRRVWKRSRIIDKHVEANRMMMLSAPVELHVEPREQHDINDRGKIPRGYDLNRKQCTPKVGARP